MGYKESEFPLSVRRQPPLCDGSVSNMLCKKEGNSSQSMVGDERLYLKNHRSCPYYFRRCKRVRPTNIESLPDDLLFHILVRLPADYLYDRARLVCHRWYHIIHSNAFVSKHIQNSTYGLNLSYHSKDRCHPIFMTATQGRVETSEFSYKCRSRLLASCNDLALELYRWGSLSCILNPATKQPFVLPSIRSSGHCFNSPGIAYAAASMEYKVAVPYWDMPDSYLAILTLGVYNAWRSVEVEHVRLQVRYHFNCFPLITEGFILWVCRNSINVLTLDVETEILTVNKSSFPKGYNCKNGWYYLSTGRFLSLLVGHRDFSWEIWGMKSETGEWSKLLPDIELGAQKCRLQEFAFGEDEVFEPFGWVNYPEVLAFRFSGGSRTCIFYNLDRHEINTTELPYSCSRFTAYAHKNSLTWLS